jgi:hypothetical protein
MKNFSTEQITVIANTDNSYLFQDALNEAFNKDRLDALDFEPILIEMANEGTFRGQAYQLKVGDVADMVNNNFGNLCYRAYYKEAGITKSNIEYAKTWGELLEALAEKAETAVDYINLACGVQLQFAAFEDRNEAEKFANTHYKNALNEINDVVEIVDFVGGHLAEEYYENEALAEQAGEKAIELAETFNDFAYICFDDNERSNFHNSDTYEAAVKKAIELKAQASEDELNDFKAMLEEYEDEENLALLN